MWPFKKKFEHFHSLQSKKLGFELHDVYFVTNIEDWQHCFQYILKKIIITSKNLKKETWRSAGPYFSISSLKKKKFVSETLKSWGFFFAMSMRSSRSLLESRPRQKSFSIFFSQGIFVFPWTDSMSNVTLLSNIYLIY